MKCEFCQNHEQGDTLYEASDWDGGIGFDYIRNIKYCPLCGSLLDGEADRKTDPTISKMEQVETMSCEECKHYVYQLGCTHHGSCAYEPKDEPKLSEIPTSSDEPQTERSE